MLKYILSFVSEAATGVEIGYFLSCLLLTKLAKICQLTYKQTFCCARLSLRKVFDAMNARSRNKASLVYFRNKRKQSS